MLHVTVEVEYNGEYLDLVVEGEFDTYGECTDLTICDEHGKRLPADYQDWLIEEFEELFLEKLYEYEASGDWRE